MKQVFLVLVITFICKQSYSQGCVAIRGTGAVCTMQNAGDHGGGWQINTSYRYFESFRHFRGKEEQKERLEQNTEVINWQHSVDIAVVRQFNNRWSLLVGLPVLANKRSSLYEHGRTERHNSGSFGIGDMRLTAYRWMLDPQKSAKGNLQIGLGLKLPTADYNYQDYFHNVGPNKTKELRPVDQSIQLGDGGTGIITELNGFYNFSRHFGLYSNFYYLLNPREVNGTRTFRETLSPALANESIMSVADQYMVRAGFVYAFAKNLKGLSVSTGARIEGIPVNDLVGGSLGFRRPGYVVSVEPGINYTLDKSTIFLTVPVAFSRNRTQSVTDKERTQLSGVHTQGDAAFADYSVSIGATFRL